MNRISFSKSLGYLIILSFSIVSVSAQVSQKIGNNSGNIDPNAVLELESITQGFLMPRMTAAQMAAITTPTSGMIIFCTDCGSGSDGELRISYSGVWQTFKGNLTGNISGNAATVTTNANLTGPITSVGNTTSVASQTGTGSKFVMDTAPTLVTPVLGVATATSVTSPIYASTPQALASGSAISWNPANGLNASVTLNQNSTLNFSTTPTAGTYGTLIITQDATGGRTLTLPSTANKVLGSSSTTTIALSSAPNAKDILNFYYDGTNCYWNIGQGYGIAATLAPTSLTSSVTGTLPVANGGTGSTTQNFVDLTTAQTVAGNKTFIGTTSGITAAMVGLGNVTNTSDANKPVSTATQTALDLKANLASPTFTGTPSLPTGTTGVTQTVSDNSTKLATTAYADAQAIAAVTGKQNTLTNSAGLAGALSDETGTGLAVFATSPTLVTPNLGTPSTLVGTNITGIASGLTAGAVTTNANLTGEVTSTGNATTVTNSAVIGKVLTGYTSGAGTVAATDNILQSIQKVDGNVALKAPLASPTFTGTPLAPTPTAGDNTTKIATTAFVTAINATTASTVSALRTEVFNGSAPNLVLGDFVGGGVVFWVNPSDNTRGLACAVTDQSTGIAWGTVQTGSTATAVGTGAANTDAMIAAQGATASNYAAGLARAYVGGGFQDWFLPSMDELLLMWSKSSTINPIAIANGGVGLSPGPSEYWSSSEAYNTHAKFLSYGQMQQNWKNGTKYVRAVRAVSSLTSTSFATIEVQQTAQNNQIALKANIASPTFTGTVSGITSTMVGLGNVTNTSDANKPVSTATQTALDLKANLASPTFTGTPTAPTATAGTNTTQLATTAFVTAATAASAGVSGSGTLNYIPKFSSATAIGNSSISEDGTGLRIGNPNGQGGVYTGLNTDNNTRLMVTGGREFESIKMSFPGDPYNNELSFNWYNSAWRMRTERSSADITDLSFWRTAGGVTTEQMRLTSQGNLGIGTNSPTEKLDVTGNVRATGTIKSAGFKTPTGTSSQFLKADGSVDSSTYLTTAGTATNVSGVVAVANGGTGSATKNFVDLTTTQTVAGAKTFSSDLSVNSLTVGIGAGNIASNTAIGNAVLRSNTIGSSNTAIGNSALTANTTGDANTANGAVALLNNTLGNFNTANGAQALYYNTTGSNNTANGMNALVTNATGNNNTALGFGADVASAALTNATAIGYGAKVAVSNTVQLGNTSVTDVKTSGAITGASFIKSGGTASQFLKADGSVDSATYLTTAGTATNVSGIVAVANGGTGSSTKNFVDLTTDQTIAGAKTFINNFQVGSGDNTSFPMKYGQLDSDNARLSFGFRGKEFRAKVNQNSGILEKLTYSYFDGTTDVEAMRIDNNSRVTIGGVTYPNTTGTANQVLTTNGSGVASWATPASSGVPYTGATGAVNLGAYNLTVNGLTVGKGNGSLSDNTAFGSGALAQTSGNSNTAIGSSALYNNGAGYANTAIGNGAGYSNGSGTYNIMIGYNANMSGLSGGVTNSIAIGNAIDVTTSNTIQLGNSSVTDLKTFGKITSGTITYPNTFGSANQVLTTNGSGVASWATPTSVSEADEQLFATAAQTSFTLTQTPRVLSKVKMYVNGIKINKLAYSVSGTTVTYVPANNNNYAISLNDRVQFEYTY